MRSNAKYSTKEPCVVIERLAVQSAQENMRCDVLQCPHASHNRPSFSLSLLTLLIHDEVQCKVLHEELRVVLHGLAVQRVQQSMTRAIRSTGAAIGLATCRRGITYATTSQTHITSAKLQTAQVGV